jgi:hypothetical protein
MTTACFHCRIPTLGSSLRVPNRFAGYYALIAFSYACNAKSKLDLSRGREDRSEEALSGLQLAFSQQPVCRSAYLSVENTAESSTSNYTQTAIRCFATPEILESQAWQFLALLTDGVMDEGAWS